MKKLAILIALAAVLGGGSLEVQAEEETEVVECDKCGGTGKVMQDAPCMRCAGTLKMHALDKDTGKVVLVECVGEDGSGKCSGTKSVEVKCTACCDGKKVVWKQAKLLAENNTSSAESNTSPAESKVWHATKKGVKFVIMFPIEVGGAALSVWPIWVPHL